MTRITSIGKHDGDLPGAPRTGNALKMTSITIHRIANGKLAEKWSDKEVLGFLQQIGVLPPLNRGKIYRGPRLIASHRRVLEATGRKYSLPEHHRPPGQGLKPKPSDSSREEERLRHEVPEIVSYLEALKKHYSGRATLPLCRLLRLVEDYPRAPLLEVIAIATQYGLFDLERVENLILRKLAREYFQILP